MFSVFGPRTPLHTETIRKALQGIKTDWLFWVFPNYEDEAKVKDLAAKLRAKVCGYFVGSDVKWVFRGFQEHKRPLTFDAVACCHDRLQKELEPMGYQAGVLPFLAEKVLFVRPIQKTQVAVYLPSVAGKYGFLECCEIAKLVPVRFVFYGCDLLPPLPRNCENRGRLTPEAARELLAECSAVLRWTSSDGFPQNIIEAKMMGRNVVTNYSYEGCLYAKSIEDAAALLSDPKTHTLDPSAWPQWFRDHCGPEAFRRNVERMLG